MEKLNLTGRVDEKKSKCAQSVFTAWTEKMRLAVAGIWFKTHQIIQALNRPFPTPSKPPGKKRGRKPKCPNDPVKKKIEEKDKFWLRMFRNYMRTKYPEISNSLNEEEKGFWQEYLSAKGVPDRNNIFSSYGKKYKDYLFGKPSYFFFFHEWFYEHGEAELGKKCTRGSDLWTVFYEHCSKELINYIPSGCEFLDGLSGVKGFGPFLVPLRKNFDDLLLMNGDDIIEFFMN